jgi:hypothetical protein
MNEALINEVSVALAAWQNFTCIELCFRVYQTLTPFQGELYSGLSSFSLNPNPNPTFQVKNVLPRTTIVGTEHLPL